VKKRISRINDSPRFNVVCLSADISNVDFTGLESGAKELRRIIWHFSTLRQLWCIGEFWDEL